MSVREDETPKNGGATELHDLETITGVLIRVEAQTTLLGEETVALRNEHLAHRGELKELRGVVIDQGGTLNKIAKALGVEPTKSVPPIRKELESLHEVDRLHAQELADTRLIVKVGMLEHMPKIAKGVGAIAVGVAALIGIVQLMYNLMAGPLKP